MAFIIPQPIKMLAAPLAALPSRAYVEPTEGKLVIPIELDWPGDGSTYEINIQGRTTQPFSQIVMLDVDNTQSGADATFYFPDTSDTLVVPAYTGGLFPVFTNGLSLYASAPAALAADVTRFRILNYRQAPVANPSPQFHSVATASNLTAAGTFALIPAGKSGTLDGYNATVSLIGGAALGSWAGTLKDHATGMIIDEGNVFVNPNDSITFALFNVGGTAIRFASGIDLVIAFGGGAFGNASASVALRYRTP